MPKVLNKIFIIIVILFSIGINKCFATVLTDTNGDFVTDSNNIPVSDTNGPPLASPGIITQPVSVTVNAPATATFSVAVSGNPTPYFQWLQEAAGANTFTAISGATSSSYTTPATTSTNNGTEYKCIVKSVLGKITSNQATLFVDNVPSIITQPKSASVLASKTATFTVVAIGVPSPTYQWQVKQPGASLFTAISGATRASFTTSSTTISNSGTQYECIISNSLGSITSNIVYLTVNPVLAAPVITTQPSSVAVTKVPVNATFTITATGYPAPTYQWQQSTNGGSTWTPIPGAIYSTLTTLVSNPVQFNCVVSNIEGTVTSNIATVTGSIAPSITTEPLNLTVAAPAPVTFTAQASGIPTPSYQWQVSTNGGVSYSPINGATASSYTVSSTTTALSGNKYELVASNGVTPQSVSNPATLTVIPSSVAPTIITQPSSVTISTFPTTVTFTVVANGTPAPTYQWQQSTDGGRTWMAIRAATNSSFTAILAFSIQFNCVVTNPAGTLTSNAALVTAAIPPTITTQPTSMAVVAPATATFSAAANGVPAPTYQWQVSTNGGSSFTPISGATSSSYTISSTSTSLNGNEYELVASNGASPSAISNPVILTVNPASVVPTITTQPASVTISTFSAKENFTIAASGTPTPTYQWQQSTDGGNNWVPISGATSASLTTIANNGTQYNCVVTNIAGAVTSNAAIVTSTNPTIGAPNITSQPVNATVISPATATFTVVATGFPAPSYQWMQQQPGTNTFTPIDGATNSYYTTPATTISNNGTQYECVINNTAGSVTSAVATLTVNQVSSYIQNINYNANGQITQIQYGNGVTTAYTYNPLNFHLMRIYSSNAQAKVIQDLNYTYDSIGQVLSVIDNVNIGPASMSQTYTYDSLNRLISASGSYGTKTYAYDSIGNITEKDGLIYNYAESNSRTDGTSAGPHAVTSLSDGSTFKYDANGNMVFLQKGSNITQYVYDTQNRLQTVMANSSVIANYLYDGDGGRTQKVVNRRDLALYNDNTDPLLFGSSNNPLSATAQNPTIDTTVYVGNLSETESGAMRSSNFIYLGDTKVASVDSRGNIFYYHNDQLGGSNLLTDNSGEVRELTEYDPFGLVYLHEKYGTDFSTAWYYFTGKPLDDETGLIFLGARYYNPSLGRFITPDTIVPSASNPQTLNRYAYCLNNPVNMVDPTGHKSWWSKFWKSFVGAFVGAVVTVLTGGLGAPIAFALGGMIGGAITGGLNGGLQGALMGGLIGGVLGGIGGYGYQLAQSAGTAFVGNAIMGGLAAGGIGYTAATGDWASFAGGLAGGITGTMAGKGLMAFGKSLGQSSAQSDDGASMYAGSEPVKKSFSITVRMVNDDSLAMPEKILLLEQVTADSMKSAAKGLAGMDGIFSPAELARFKMVGYGALGVQGLGELYSITKLYAMVQNGVISSDKFSQALAVHAAGVFVKAGAAAIGEAVGAATTKSAGGAFLVGAGSGAAASIGWDTFEDYYDHTLH